MFHLTSTAILLTFNALSHPGDQIADAPTSVRSFSPESEVNDDIIETYFTQSGPLSIEFYEHLTLLANPWLGGRQPGTEGSGIAGEYIVWNLSKNGLTPAFEDNTDWYQRFDFNVDSAPPEVLSSFASIDDIAFIEGRDYAVLGNSGNGEVEAPVTFVGYAIEEGEGNYTSFDEADDLTGQIALMLRYEPLDEDGASQWAGRRFSPHSNIREKMNAVIQRGAVGVILVNPPHCRDGRRGLETASSSRFGTTNIPVVHMTEDVINAALTDDTVRSLQSKADAGEVRTTPLMINATLKTEVNTGGMQAKNIGGVLKGKGDLANEWLIIGGHYDHVGHGYVGTRYPGQLHHGADDNASGTSLVLILSRLLSEYYASSDDDSLRSVMFLFFDAEEAGLHGSAHFVKYPIIKLDDVNAMINIDMVGNLSQNNVLIGGTGTAEEFDAKIPEWIQSSILTANLMPSGT
ncbi:MAG: M28 family peptidase, partial [Phycisphaerales bacterium]|nr:M28 family peptidase [Phycisphaerales bacterium]